MADNTTIVINFTLEDDDTSSQGEVDSSIDMDQRGGEGTTGYTECMENEFADGRVVSGSEYMAASDDCSGEHCTEDGKLSLDILVYKVPIDLNYTFTLTEGEIGEMYIESENYSESHNIQLNDYLTLDRSFESEPTAYWEGSCYNKDGVIIKDPEIDWVELDNTFYFTTSSGAAIEVVGTLRVNGSVHVEVWPIIVEPRGETDSGSDFASTARCFFDSKVAEHNVETPEGKEGNCGKSGEETEIDPEDEKCYKKIVYLDPCTGEKTRDDEYEQIKCPEDEYDEGSGR